MDRSGSESNTSHVSSDVAVIPVIEESARILKRKVETGKVRIEKKVVSERQTLRAPVRHEHVEIERVEVNRPVDEYPDIRVEGDTTIIPVVEETFEVIKRLVLKEEIRVQKITDEDIQDLQAELRREQVEIHRLSEGE
jgi:uncharacterized protein (TIGR02271 family)